jgi:hypothetical protein
MNTIEAFGIKGSIALAMLRRRDAASDGKQNHCGDDCNLDERDGAAGGWTGVTDGPGVSAAVRVRQPSLGEVWPAFASIPA